MDRQESKGALPGVMQVERYRDGNAWRLTIW